MKIVLDLVFSLSLEQMDLVKEAAKLKELSVPEYVEKIILTAVKKDLKIAKPKTH